MEGRGEGARLPSEKKWKVGGGEMKQRRGISRLLGSEDADSVYVSKKLKQKSKRSSTAETRDHRRFTNSVGAVGKEVNMNLKSYMDHVLEHRPYFNRNAPVAGKKMVRTFEGRNDYVSVNHNAGGEEEKRRRLRSGAGRNKKLMMIVRSLQKERRYRKQMQEEIGEMKTLFKTFQMRQ